MFFGWLKQDTFGMFVRLKRALIAKNRSNLGAEPEETSATIWTYSIIDSKQLFCYFAMIYYDRWWYAGFVWRCSLQYSICIRFHCLPPLGWVISSLFHVCRQVEKHCLAWWVARGTRVCSCQWNAIRSGSVAASRKSRKVEKRRQWDCDDGWGLTQMQWL